MDRYNLHKTNLELQVHQGQLSVRWQPDSSSLGRRLLIHSDCDEVNEYLMQSLFDNLSNGSIPTSISRWQDLQIIMIICCCFCQVLRCCRGLVIHLCYPAKKPPLGPWPKFWHAQRRWRTHQGSLGLLPLGHFLRMSSLSPSRTQQQSVVKRTPRSHMDSISRIHIWMEK